MRIVVTGALGHIGSYIIRHLPSYFKNSEIILIDSLMTQRYSSLFNLPSNAVFKFIKSDLHDLDLVKLFYNIDFVIHLAAITDASWSLKNVEEIEINNFQSTQKVAEACGINKCKLVSLSTTSVYGTQNETVDENCSKKDLRPQSPYAKSKLKEEKFLNNYNNSHNLDFISCRFGTIYGVSPGMRFHTAVNKFCWQASFNTPITIWETAYDQKRPYLDLKDALRAIIFIIENNIFDGEVYNIVSNCYTVRNIVELIKEFVPNLEIKFIKNEIMNQLSYEVLNTKFKSKGFLFNGNLKKGIMETIDLLMNKSKTMENHTLTKK